MDHSNKDSAMGTQETLFLHEEIMLLALQDDKGTVAWGTYYQYALGGAILAELLLNNLISIEVSKKKKMVNLVGTTSVVEPVIDECLKKISSAKRRASVQTWVSKFAELKRLKHRIATQLCKRGILQVAEDKVFLFFTRKVYPEINPEPEKALIERLRKAIFTNTADIDPRTVILLSLANSAGLLKLVFDRGELKSRKARIGQIVNGEMVGEAAKEAIEAMETALVISTVVTSSVVTTTSSS